MQQLKIEVRVRDERRLEPGGLQQRAAAWATLGKGARWEVEQRKNTGKMWKGER